HRADRDDVSRWGSKHFLGFLSHCLDLPGRLVDRDDGGLVHDDSLSLREDDSIRGPEIDREIVREEAQQGTGRPTHPGTTIPPDYSESSSPSPSDLRSACSMRHRRKNVAPGAM